MNFLLNDGDDARSTRGGKGADLVNRFGVTAFWMLVVAIVGMRVALFQPDTFASLGHQEITTAAHR